MWPVIDWVIFHVFMNFIGFSKWSVVIISEREKGIEGRQIPNMFTSHQNEEADKNNDISWVVHDPANGLLGEY